MTIVGEDYTDIRLDHNGQPVVDDSGDFATVEGDECWKQDLWMESHTDEGELFYEDMDGDEAYGFGMTEFIHAEDSDLTKTEISQRISGKLEKREYLDQGKTKQTITHEGDRFSCHISVYKQDANDEYNLDLTADIVEVEYD